MNRRATNVLDRISLSHGQVRWLLRHLFDLGEDSDATFDAYLKFLRRHGVPFAKGETPGSPGVNVVYDYEHIMELAVALALRRQAILKKDTVGLLVRLRDELRPLYPRAWLERDRGLGKRVTVEVAGAKPLKVPGLWLDLGLRYSEGQVLSITGRPKLLGPAGAVREFCTVNRQRYFRDPIRISDLAAAVVELAAAAPEYRRGRR